MLEVEINAGWGRQYGISTQGWGVNLNNTALPPMLSTWMRCHLSRWPYNVSFGRFGGADILILWRGGWEEVGARTSGSVRCHLHLHRRCDFCLCFGCCHNIRKLQSIALCGGDQVENFNKCVANRLCPKPSVIPHWMAFLLIAMTVTSAVYLEYATSPTPFPIQAVMERAIGAI